MRQAKVDINESDQNLNHCKISLKEDLQPKSWNTELDVDNKKIYVTVKSLSRLFELSHLLSSGEINCSQSSL